MARSFSPKIVTANALIEGDVIYLCADDTWTRDLQSADVITDEADADVRLISAASQTSVAVGVYLAEIELHPDGLKTKHFREEFRKSGPSNYFHGKQAG